MDDYGFIGKVGPSTLVSTYLMISLSKDMAFEKILKTDATSESFG